ncbi:primosomal protein N' [Limnohabitans sp. JirII-29]|uniref:replication restart helicase PriA n=1 Tax=Limnohabitans sp. JirII-29 TaxID=1835756 RepID=UPI000D3AC958|nr:primosomal protein N' [Limnohabitans sp. JirII-29]PUE24633.1 primosomal protein N' [Limnohabitans sp. JirII-29]
MSHPISVMVHTPAHSGLGGALTYSSDIPVDPGALVRVPLGSRELLGVVWDDTTQEEHVPGIVLRPIACVLEGLAPLSPHWRQLVQFAAHYYQRSIGEVALAALPNQLRELSAEQWNRRLKRKAKALSPSERHTPDIPVATQEQAQVLDQIAAHKGPFLLFGNTGSGKTEVYLRAAQDVLTGDPRAQILVMVPEINLTPQLEARFRERFAPQWGEQCLVTMHSGLTPAQRLNHWLAAHNGQARIVLGTRMAVFASMPQLQLIVVDEEHDPSYKQQEGARYSARDLAVYRGQLEHAKVILGSATPSLESWHHSRPATDTDPAGRYLRLHMPSRVGQGALPLVRRVDMNRQPYKTVFSSHLLDAMRERIARDEQILVLLNRRGYAPVLHCTDCGWKSECPHCSAYRVFHKLDRTLRCHHCGYTQAVPRACPSCGNQDISPLGRGTEQLEEHLGELLADVRRPDGTALRIARIDADSTRLKGELERQLAEVHAGAIDILVGTQMIAKGHDFRRVTLVAALNPDGALFSSDFRAPERLFSLLMQAAGRAGRDASMSLAHACEMWVQSFHPQHPLFEALKQHDYPAFADQQLKERLEANLPPFSFQALVRAEARSQQAAQDFLSAARDAGTAWADDALVDIYPAVPMSIQRVANIERAQMLLECTSRKALQGFLSHWQAQLHTLRGHHKQVIRWAIDVDPLAI